MREQAYDLALLSLQLRDRVKRLLPLVRYVQPPVDAARDRDVAHVTVELLNAWSSFTRAFYISCALRARTAAGIRVAIAVNGLATPNDALMFAMKTLKGWNKPFQRRQEPSWHDVKNIITLVSTIGASNINTVVAALSHPTHAFRCLPIARNFFSHRNIDTARKCRALSATLQTAAAWRPADVLVQRDYTRPNNVLTEWITDVATVADMMVQ